MRAAALLSLFFVLSGPVLADDIPWRLDYAASYREAQQSGRPLVVYCSRLECPPCRRLEATTLRDAEVVRLLGHCVPVRLTAAAAQEAGFAVSEFPTLKLAAAGEVKHTIRGYHDAALLRRALAEILATAPAAGAAAALPTGVDPSQLATVPTLHRGTQHAPAETIQGDPRLPDLSRKPFLTVASRNTDQRERLATALRATPLDEHWRIGALDPASPLAAGFKLDQDRRFQASDLVVIAQAPPAAPGGFGAELGKVYGVADPAALERTFGRSDPRYDPNRPAAGAGGIGSLALWACVALGLMAAAVVCLPPAAPTDE